ncbi:MAG: RNA polymerase sigma factor [Gemmatimonadota bacterium]
MTDMGRGVTHLKKTREVVPTENDAVDAMLAAAGDAIAFERLYRRHLGRVNSLARRMIGPDDADDATQAVFIRAWEKLGTFRGESAFGTWLHRLAINVMLARRSTLGIERGRFLDAEGTVEKLTGRSSHKDLSIDFEDAIERLPGGAREVFVLHDIEGYKHEEIAVMLGIVSGTSKAQLHRARMALRGHLNR